MGVGAYVGGAPVASAYVGGAYGGTVQPLLPLIIPPTHADVEAIVRLVQPRSVHSLAAVSAIQGEAVVGHILTAVRAIARFGGVRFKGRGSSVRATRSGSVAVVSHSTDVSVLTPVSSISAKSITSEADVIPHAHTGGVLVRSVGHLSPIVSQTSVRTISHSTKAILYKWPR